MSSTQESLLRRVEMRTLHLTIIEKWMDLIHKREKPLEYREVKDHWNSRLLDKHGKPREYDQLHIVNGYGKDRPYLILKWNGFVIVQGDSHIPINKEPLDFSKSYFAIDVTGEILAKGNFSITTKAKEKEPLNTTEVIGQSYSLIGDS